MLQKSHVLGLPEPQRTYKSNIIALLVASQTRKVWQAAKGRDTREDSVGLRTNATSVSSLHCRSDEQCIPQSTSPTRPSPPTSHFIPVFSFSLYLTFSCNFHQLFLAAGRLQIKSTYLRPSIPGQSIIPQTLMRSCFQRRLMIMSGGEGEDGSCCESRWGQYGGPHL